MGKCKRNFRPFGRRALSPIFATMLLAAIIITFGSIAYYFSSNLTSTATNNYVQTSTNSQQAISERIGFEDVQYASSSSTLSIYIINCGSANGIQINLVFIYDSNNNIVGQPYSGSQAGHIFTLYSIGSGTQVQSNSLNVGKEGYFTVTPVTLVHGTFYRIHLITKSGSSFDYAFTA